MEGTRVKIWTTKSRRKYQLSNGWCYFWRF